MTVSDWQWKFATQPSYMLSVKCHSLWTVLVGGESACQREASATGDTNLFFVKKKLGFPPLFCFTAPCMDRVRFVMFLLVFVQVWHITRW